MRPHLVIRLRHPSPRAVQLPQWEDAIRQSAAARTPLTPEIGTLLAERAIDALFTREYAPGAADWSDDERASGLDRVFRIVLLNRGSVPADLAPALRQAPGVEDVRAGLVGVAELPDIRSLSIRPQANSAHDRIGLPTAHRVTRGDERVMVAVLDTGVYHQHPEFGGRFAAGKDFVDILSGAEAFLGDVLGVDHEPDDDVGHGTHVAGIVGARGQAMPVGVAPDCTIMPVRVLAALRQDDGVVGAGLIDNINAGVKHAVDSGALIINMSLGVRHSGGGLPHREVVEYANRRGVLIVAAAGNDGQEQLYYPGALPGVAAIGAAAAQAHASAFSSYGEHVMMVAPGEDIYSALPGDQYGMASGTSHAAPFVAAAAALIQSLARRAGGLFSPAQLRTILSHTADRFGRANRDKRAGFGMLNIADALRLAQLEINEGTSR